MLNQTVIVEMVTCGLKISEDDSGNKVTPLTKVIFYQVKRGKMVMFKCF